MPSQKEIEFSRKRFELQDEIMKVFRSTVEEYGLRMQQVGAKLDPVVGYLRGDTIGDQEISLYVEVAKPNTMEMEKVYVTITDLSWNPVLTIWGRSSTEPASIIITGPVSEALPEIREKITEYLARAFEK